MAAVGYEQQENLDSTRLLRCCQRPASQSASGHLTCRSFLSLPYTCHELLRRTADHSSKRFTSGHTPITHDSNWRSSPLSMRSVLKQTLTSATLVQSHSRCTVRPAFRVQLFHSIPLRLLHRTSFISTMPATATSAAAASTDASTSSSAAATSPVARVVPLLHTYSLTGYIVPTADAHQSEYVAECDFRRAYISGFTGSAGTALLLSPSVSPTHKLWTDGRYFLQASQQLSPDWELMRSRQPGVPELEDFIATALPEGSHIGVDPTTLSVTGYKALQDSCKPKGIEIVTHTANLIDEVWGAHRPAVPSQPIIVHGEPWAGESAASKVPKVRAELVKHKCHALVVSTLDEIAWLLNVRGSDVEYNPVFFAYVIVTADDVLLFVEPSKVSDEVRAHFDGLVSYQPYSSFFSYLSSSLVSKLSATNRLWLDPHKANQAIYAAVPDSAVVWLSDSPVGVLKSVKNEVEVAGVREAHKRDAVAMCEFLSWLEEEAVKDGVSLNEVSIGDKLAEFRGKQKWSAFTLTHTATHPHTQPHTHTDTHTHTHTHTFLPTARLRHPC